MSALPLSRYIYYILLCKQIAPKGGGCSVVKSCPTLQPHELQHGSLPKGMCVCVCVRLVTQSCPTLCDPMDYRPPGSSVHGILQARVLECVAISSPRGSSQPRDRTQVSHIVGRFFTVWATREAQMELVSNAHTNLTKCKFTLKIIQPYSLIQCFSQVWHYG